MAALLDILKKGSTDRSVTIRIIDSTDGTPETGVVWNTAGIDLWYRREGAAKTAITEASLSALTDAHSDGGFLHVGDGEYRLDLPDAAIAAGANYVDVGGTVTNMVVIGGRIRLTDIDLEDSVRAGMTALPNATADAAGGLPISDAGGLDLDTLNSNVAAVLDDTGTNGVVVAAASKTGYSLTATTGLGNQTADITGNLSGSVGSVTGNVGGIAGTLNTLDDLDTAQDTQHSTTQAAIAALNDLSAAAVNAEVDTALADYDPPTYTELLNLVRVMVRQDAALVTDLAAVITSINTDLGSGAGAFANTTDSQEAIRDHIGDGTNLTEAGGTGDHLTAIDLPDQTMNITGNITGNLSGSVGSITNLTVQAATTLATGTHNPQSGDAYARLGAPAGASVSADIAALPTATEVVDEWETQSQADPTGFHVNLMEINSTAASAVRLALSAGQIIPGTVDTVTNGHTPTPTEFQADDITTSAADHYNGRRILFTSGVLAGQATSISDYVTVGGIGQFTVVALTSAPADDVTFIIV